MLEIHISVLLFIGTQPVDESQVVVSFHQWLGSVTERINQTMHYQFDGMITILLIILPFTFFFFKKLLYSVFKNLIFLVSNLLLFRIGNHTLNHL